MRIFLKSRFPRYMVTVGGASELGQAICRVSQKRFDVFSIDTQENKNARWSIVYDPSQSIESQAQEIIANIEKQIKTEDHGIDAVICTAGAGQVLQQGEDSFARWSEAEKRIVSPALLSAHLAYKYLNPKGMLTFFGSHQAFVKENPKRLEYHTGYVCVHNLAMNMASKKVGRGVPESANTFTILTDLIGSAEMRQKHPEVDWSKHPTCDELAKMVWSWAKSPDYRPFNNCFLRVKKTQKVCETQVI